MCQQIQPPHFQMRNLVSDLDPRVPSTLSTTALRLEPGLPVVTMLNSS